MSTTLRPRPALAFAGGTPVRSAGLQIRWGTPDDAGTLHALIGRHVVEGHLLPRTLDDLRTHASRFVVALREGALVGCAELAPLSRDVAEVRSLVVDAATRGTGLGRLMLNELRRKAERHRYARLVAFAHDPKFFVRLGFSIVPHLWVPEKVSADCRGCALFRACGQHALMLTLSERARTTAPVVPLSARAG